MKKHGIQVLPLALLFSFAAIAQEVPDQPVNPKNPPPPKSKKFELRYAMFFPDIPKGTQELIIQLPMPQTDQQQKAKLTGVTTTMGASHQEYYDAKYDNKIFLKKIRGFVPQMMEVYTIYDIERFEVKAKDSLQNRTDLKVWLSNDQVNKLSANVKKTAKEIAGQEKDPTQKGKLLYDYLIQNVRFDNKVPAQPRATNTGDILSAKKGNAVEYHALFTDLCRAAGLPARMAFGFKIDPEKKEGKMAQHDCWAEFYAEGRGWVPVDFETAFAPKAKPNELFGALDYNRVTLSYGTAIPVLDSTPPDPVTLDYFIYPYILADGKVYPNIQPLYEYRIIKKKEDKSDKIE